MKKRMLTLGRALTLCLGLFAGCGAPQEEPEGPVTHGSGTTEGTLDGNTYTMPGIGVKLTLSDDFEVFTGKALDQMLKSGASAFYRFAARNRDRQEVVTFLVPKSEKQAEAYLEEAAGQLEDQRDEVGEVGETELGGITWKSLRTEASSDDAKLVEWTFVYEKSGNLFVLNDVCTAEDEEDVLADLDTKVVSKLDDAA